MTSRFLLYSLSPEKKTALGRKSRIQSSVKFIYLVPFSRRKYVSSVGRVVQKLSSRCRK